MFQAARRLLLAALLAAAAVPLSRAAAQTPMPSATLGLELFNTKRATYSRIWGSGEWVAFTIEESPRDLNNDGDTDDTILCLFSLRTYQATVTSIAVDTLLADDDQDWFVAISGDQAVIQCSEADQGNHDLNGNGKPEESVLVLYNLTTKGAVNLGVTGRRPTFVGGKLYLLVDESFAKRDLNADNDQGDQVLCTLDLATRRVDTLGIGAEEGFKAAGDWIATWTSEANQGGKDLNGDKDADDTVIELYQVSQKKWTNTALEGNDAMALTPQLLAISTDEKKQGNRDLNGNGKTEDLVLQVWNLSTGKAFDTKQDCSGGICADGGLVGFATQETSQNEDLNGDGDKEDLVAQYYTLGGGKVVSLRIDGSGGMVAEAGRLAFGSSEADQKKTDLNGDGDAEDFVLQTYDPASNKLVNMRFAVDGDLVAADGYLTWRVLEADQGNRDLNRDNDRDDSVLHVMDLTTGAFLNTSYAATDHVCITPRGVAFGVLEADQGNRDLNMNAGADDEVVMVGRFKARM